MSRTARDLAEQALRIAGDMKSDEIRSFEWRSTPSSGIYRVLIHLTNGSTRGYLVLEEKERDTSNDESLPW